jgi:hypothetical protein
MDGASKRLTALPTDVILKTTKGTRMKDLFTMIQVVEDLNKITSMKQLENYIRNQEIELAYAEAEIAREAAIDSLFDNVPI